MYEQWNCRKKLCSTHLVLGSTWLYMTQLKQQNWGFEHQQQTSQTAQKTTKNQTKFALAVAELGTREFLPSNVFSIRTTLQANNKTWTVSNDTRTHERKQQQQQYRWQMIGKCAIVRTANHCHNPHQSMMDMNNSGIMPVLKRNLALFVTQRFQSSCWEDSPRPDLISPPTQWRWPTLRDS